MGGGNPFIYSNVVRNIGNKAKKNFIVKPHSVGVGFCSLRTFQRLSLDTWLVSATISLWTEPKTDTQQHPHIKNVPLNLLTVKQIWHDFWREKINTIFYCEKRLIGRHSFSVRTYQWFGFMCTHKLVRRLVSDTYTQLTNVRNEVSITQFHLHNAKQN